MKQLPKIVFSLYIVCLLWLVLFKTSLDFSSVLNIHMQNINSIPFTGRRGEMIENFVVFIPLGLLLSAAFKKITFWQKTLIIFVFSLVVETIQYVLAIGISDITDIITNTLGGLLGLTIYARFANSKKTDNIIAISITILIAIFLLLRFFILKVRY